MTTKQSIHEKKEKLIFELNEELIRKDEAGHCLNRETEDAITSFYDTQIQQLLDEIVLKEKEIVSGENVDMALLIEYKNRGFNSAIQEIKTRIKEAGY